MLQKTTNPAALMLAKNFEPKTKGLKNPAAVMLATDFAKSEQGQKTISQATNAIKLILLGAGVFFAAKLGLKEYHKYLAKKYLNENGHKPEAQAALMMYNAMFTISLDFGWLGNFNIIDGTDEALLNKLALEIKGLQDVSNAYKIIFRRNLLTDVKSELDSAELRAFFKRLQTKGADITTPAKDLVPYLKGSPIYVRNTKGVTARKGVKESNKWIISNDSKGFFEFGDKVGSIYDIVKQPSGEILYIIDNFTTIETLTGYTVLNHRDTQTTNPEN